MKDPAVFNRNLTILGFIVGALFPVITVMADLSGRDLSLQPEHIANIFITNKFQWFVLLMPVIIGVFFNYLAKILLMRERYLTEKLQKEKEQFQLMEDVVVNLEKRDFIINNVQSDVDDETKRVVDLVSTFKTKFHRDRDAESQRQWMMGGLNELNTILMAKDKIDKLSERVLHFLVKYTQTIQGNLFLYVENGDDKFLELKSYYAYDRKKFVERRFALGEGVVGQCFIEKSRILLYDVPQGYTKITSGLGESTPDCLVVIPLLSNENVEGVIELAGFRKLMSHELEFLDKAAERIGNMLSNLKTNELTQTLLEDSQSQAEQMRAQEEEMRQNLEELAATEEEMVRKEQEYIRKINELELKEAEMQRLSWESRHRIESLQALLEKNNIKFSFNSNEEVSLEQNK